MIRVAPVALLALLLGAGCMPTDTHEHGLTGDSSLWVMGYWGGWQRTAYPKEAIDYQAFTHLVLANVYVEPSGAISNGITAPYNGYGVYSDSDPGNNDRIRDLAARAHAAGRPVLLMLGGSGFGANWRSSTSAANLETFMVNVLAEVDAVPADGLDFAWDGLGAVPADVDQLVELARRLKTARPELLLTVGLPWTVPDGIAALLPHVERFNLHTYGMFDAAQGWVSWHFAALHPGTHPELSSVEASVESAVAAGLPRGRVGFGIGFFGMLFQGPDAPYGAVTGPGMEVVDASGAPLPGFYADGSDGIFTYANIKRYYLDPNPTSYVWYDDVKMGGLSFPAPGFTPTDFVPDGDPAWATGGSEAWRKRATWLSYEDPRSIQAKGEWARAEGVGGVVLWTINNGCTDPATGENLPLAAVKAASLP
jgi:chitinase